MKVLFFLTYYKPHISGPVSYIENLTAELVEKGILCTILTSRHIKSLEKIEVKNGVITKRLPVLCTLGKGVIVPALFTDGVKEIKRNDIIIVNLPQLEAGMVAIITKFFGKKALVIHHTDLSGWTGWWNRISELVVDLSGLISCRLAEKIFPYTKDYADSSTLLRKFKKKVFPLYPIVKIEGDDKVYANFLAKQGNVKTKFIGYSGRIARQKKLEDAIESIKILNKIDGEQKWKLLLAGPVAVGERYGKEFLEKAKRNVDVIYLGPLNRKQLASFYQFIDVLVLPSDDRLESFGLVQVEAMLHGCPVIATELPGCRIPIKKTGMGKLIPPNNPEKLAQAINKVVSLGKNHWRMFVPKVENIFSGRTSVNNFLTVLKQIDRD